MGAVIIDGRARLQFKGPILKFETALRGLNKLQNKLGPDSLKIETVPLPERGALIVEIQFRGPISEFETVMTGLNDLGSTIGIDTVPLPERVRPIPDPPENAFGWTIFAHLTE